MEARVTERGRKRERNGWKGREHGGKEGGREKERERRRDLQSVGSPDGQNWQGWVKPKSKASQGSPT